MRRGPPTHPTSPGMLQLGRIKLPRGCMGESTNPVMPRVTPSREASFQEAHISVGKAAKSSQQYIPPNHISHHHVNVDILKTVKGRKKTKHIFSATEHCYGSESMMEEILDINCWDLSVVFASPTGYMLTSSNFPLLNWVVFYKFLYNDR